MTPEKQEQLEFYITEIAKLLYEDTPQEALENLSTIEKYLRQQWLETLGPQVGFFLSKKQREQIRDVPEH